MILVGKFVFFSRREYILADILCGEELSPNKIVSEEKMTNMMCASKCCTEDNDSASSPQYNPPLYSDRLSFLLRAAQLSKLYIISKHTPAIPSSKSAIHNIALHYH